MLELKLLLKTRKVKLDDFPIKHSYEYLLQQFGGFYKHQVESALNSPERLFHLMGYVSSGQQSMVLEGPVELDKVTVVARDCLLAFVECQVRIHFFLIFSSLQIL